MFPPIDLSPFPGSLTHLGLRSQKFCIYKALLALLALFVLLVLTVSLASLILLDLLEIKRC